jgi:hypothetical protein
VLLMRDGVKYHVMATQKTQLRRLDKERGMNTLWLMIVAVLAVFSFALDRWLTVYDNSKGHLV